MIIAYHGNVCTASNYPQPTRASSGCWCQISPDSPHKQHYCQSPMDPSSLSPFSSLPSTTLAETTSSKGTAVNVSSRGQSWEGHPGVVHNMSHEIHPRQHGEQLLLRRFAKRRRKWIMGLSLTNAVSDVDEKEPKSVSSWRSSQQCTENASCSLPLVSSPSRLSISPTSSPSSHLPLVHLPPAFQEWTSSLAVPALLLYSSSCSAPPPLADTPKMNGTRSSTPWHTSPPRPAPEPITPSSCSALTHQPHHKPPKTRFQDGHCVGLRWLFHVILLHIFTPTWVSSTSASMECDVVNNCSRPKKQRSWSPLRMSFNAGCRSLVRCLDCLANGKSRMMLRSSPSSPPSTPKALPSGPCWTAKILVGTLLLMHGVFDVVDSAKVGSFQCGAGVHSSLACLPKDYSKYELPMKSGVNEIFVSIHIDEVLRINDKDYSITFACYFNVKWLDKRIRLDSDFGQEQAGPGVNVTNNPNILVPTSLEMVKDLWLPNIFIYNIKTYKVIDVLNKLAGLWIGTDKSVMYSQATHITFICPMRFDKFPLDTQTCKFQVGSYSYDDSKMTFETEVAAYSEPKTANSIALDYAITINKLKDSDQVFLGGPLGNFSLAGFEMVLHRYVSTYIITYYLPSGLFVIVSWISFLIPMDVIPGRMALLVTLFLVLVNIFNTVTTNTPKAEGLTAIEAWMLACILFVFGALIEYAAILFKKQRYVSSQHRLNIKIVCKDNFKYEVQERAATSAVSLQQLAEEYWRIDKFFLISFPILFFIFNIIYWLAFIL